MHKWLQLVSETAARDKVAMITILSAFLAYELILTFDEAVKFTRSRKCSAILMFLTSQCVILCLVVINVLGMLPLTTNTVCRSYAIFYV